MIIVTGSVLTREDTVDEALRISLEHVERSRREPGCLTHGVFRSAEDPLHLFFYEEWQDQASIDAHFRVPASLAFVEALGALTASRPTMQVLTTTDAP